MSNTRKLCLSLLIVFGVFALDQWSKIWIVSNQGSLPLEVTSFFNLVFTLNKGITFGWLGGLGKGGPFVLAGVALFVALYILRLMVKTPCFVSKVFFAFVLGGALGNVLDRVRVGAVVDFLDFHMFGYHWYAFNIADSFIVVGVFGLLFMLKEKNEKKKF